MMKQEIQGDQSKNHMKMEKLQRKIEEMVVKQYQSSSLHSGVASEISCSETNLSNGFKSSSLT